MFTRGARVCVAFGLLSHAPCCCCYANGFKDKYLVVPEQLLSGSLRLNLRPRNARATAKTHKYKQICKKTLRHLKKENLSKM